MTKNHLNNKLKRGWARDVSQEEFLAAFRVMMEVSPVPVSDTQLPHLGVESQKGTLSLKSRIPLTGSSVLIEKPNSTQPEPSNRINLSAIVPRYMSQLKTEWKSARTIATYQERIGYFVVFLDEHGISDAVCDCLTPDTARDFTGYLQGRTKYQDHPYIHGHPEALSPKSIEGRVKMLKILSSWVCREGYLNRDPLAGYKLPKVPQMLPNPLTDEEITVVFRYIDRETPLGERNYIIVFFLLDTGLRVSEFTGLRFENVDLERRQLRFIGKGAKERMVPFGIESQQLLRDYITRMWPQGQNSPEDHVFLGSAGQPLTPNAVKQMFARLRKKTGIKNLHAHILRDTFAVKYLLNGGDIATLQRILGHSDLNTVRLYLNFTESQIAAQHSRFSPMDNFQFP